MCRDTYDIIDDRINIPRLLAFVWPQGEELTKWGPKYLDSSALIMFNLNLPAPFYAKLA